MKRAVMASCLLFIIFCGTAMAAPIIPEAILTEAAPDYEKLLLLGDQVNFDYMFTTNALPGSYSGQTYDVVVVNKKGGSWDYLGQVGSYYSTDWLSKTLVVPLALQGQEQTIRFHLSNYGPQITEVALANIASNAPVPEPATLLLLGSGLLGLAALNRKKRS